MLREINKKKRLSSVNYYKYDIQYMIGFATILIILFTGIFSLKNIDEITNYLEKKK